MAQKLSNTEIIHYLYKWRYYILGITPFFFIVSFLYFHFLFIPKYQASLSFYVTTPDIESSTEVLVDTRSKISNDNTELQLMMAFGLSDGIIRRIADSLHLPATEPVFNDIKKNYSIESNNKYEITITANNPDIHSANALATAVLNNMNAMYDEYVMGYKKSQANSYNKQIEILLEEKNAIIDSIDKSKVAMGDNEKFMEYLLDYNKLVVKVADTKSSKGIPGSEMTFREMIRVQNKISRLSQIEKNIGQLHVMRSNVLASIDALNYKTPVIMRQAVVSLPSSFSSSPVFNALKATFALVLMFIAGLTVAKIYGKDMVVFVKNLKPVA